MAELQTLELLYTESLDKFNEHSESRGFHKEFTLCSRLPAGSTGHPINSCPDFGSRSPFRLGSPKQDVLSFKEHAKMYPEIVRMGSSETFKKHPTIYINLTSSIFEPLNPWWNENIALESPTEVLKASENVLCMVYRKDVDFVTAVMYDVIADEIVGVVWFKHTELALERRSCLQQMIISGDGSLVGILQQRTRTFTAEPAKYVVYILGLDSQKCQSVPKNPSDNPIFGEIHVYSTLHYILDNLSGIENSPIRIDFIPAYQSYQYLISNVKDLSDQNGNKEDAYLAKMDIRSKDQTAVTKLRGTQMKAISRNMKHRNLLFAKDGELIISCFEKFDEIAHCLYSRHAIISTATLDILAWLEHELVINIRYSERLCYSNVTPLISRDESCIAIASSFPIYCSQIGCVRHGGESNVSNWCWSYLYSPDERSESMIMMNVYRLPVVPKSLQSLAKLCIKRCTTNDPKKIKQLALPPSIQRYVYDY